MDEDQVASSFASRDEPVELEPEEVDLASINGDDAEQESQKLRSSRSADAEMASVQAFNLNTPEDEITTGDSDTQADVVSLDQSRHNEQSDDQTTVDGDYVKNKLANRELREKAATRKFQLFGLVAGGAIVLGVVGWLIFAGG